MVRSKFPKTPAFFFTAIIALVFAATMTLAVICALLPALRAARLNPVDALRYE